MPPLGELWEAAGLEVHRGWVGHGGTDWEAVDDFFDDDLDDLHLEDEDWEDEGREDDDWVSATRDPSHRTDDVHDDQEEDDAAAELMAEIAQAYDHDEHDVEGITLVLGAYRMHVELDGLGEDATYGRLAQVVAFPGVARMLALYAWSEPGLEPFMTAVEAAAARGDAAGPRFVLAA